MTPKQPVLGRRVGWVTDAAQFEPKPSEGQVRLRHEYHHLGTDRRYLIVEVLNNPDGAYAWVDMLDLYYNLDSFDSYIVGAHQLFPTPEAATLAAIFRGSPTNRVNALLQARNNVIKLRRPNK